MCIHGRRTVEVEAGPRKPSAHDGRGMDSMGFRREGWRGRAWGFVRHVRVGAGWMTWGFVRHVCIGRNTCQWLNARAGAFDGVCSHVCALIHVHVCASVRRWVCVCARG